MLNWKLNKRGICFYSAEHYSVSTRAVVSNRPTEALASVISFAFVVYSHYKNSKYPGREVNHGPIASRPKHTFTLYHKHYFLHLWLNCRNERSQIESQETLAQCASFYCARKDRFGERLCNHWLNYFTKQRNLSEISFPYKEYLSAASEIKNCSGISKPLVLLSRKIKLFVQCLIF